MKQVDLLRKEKETIFALLYGASGTGKTEFSGTLGELGRVLIIDIDMGSLTLKYSKRVAKFLDNLTVVSFDKFGDLDTAYKCIEKNDPAEWSKVLDLDITEPFDWVVWDSWSELQWNMLQELRDKQGMLSSKLDFRKNLQIQHWGAMTDLNKLSIESLRAAGKKSELNQLFIMLEGMTKDEISGVITGGPAIHGKLLQEVPGYFHVVLYSYNDLSGKYRITTKPKGRYPAKTRLGEGQDVESGTAKHFFSIKG